MSKHLYLFHNPVHPPRTLAHLPGIKIEAPLREGGGDHVTLECDTHTQFRLWSSAHFPMLYEDRAPTALPH